MTHFILPLNTLESFIRSIRMDIQHRDLGGRNWNTYEYSTSLSNRMRQQYAGEAIPQSYITAHEPRWKMISAMLQASLAVNGESRQVYFVTRERSAVPDGALASAPIYDYSRSWFSIHEGAVPDGVRGIPFTMPALAWPEPQEGSAPAEQAVSDIIIRPLTGWAQGYVEIAPTPEAMATTPASIRALATRTLPAPRSGTGGMAYIGIDGINFANTGRGSQLPTAQELITQARQTHREMVRERLGRPYAVEDAEFERKRKEHRDKTAKNFEAFVRERAKDTEHHIGKLPFVPHGLAASRRWGIEVESGGARGVETPESWSGKGDGSLRSAYSGYVEVQDFEPFDEEVTERIRWQHCSVDHQPSREILDTVHGYIMEVNPDYVDPRTCTACGDVTHMVRREPQTIHHVEKPGDCREFVSPILTSMHSKGLEALTTALSKNPQSDSAGVHVHVEANDLSKEQIATIVYGYDILEPILEASYRRNVRTYCERREVEEVLAAARKARSGGLSGEEGGRYRTLNTQSLSVHGTLEFRAMGPVYEYDYLIRWAMLCRELVNSVANGAKTKDFAKIKSWDDLTAFLALFGKEYIRAAVYEMTGEVGEVAKLEKAGEPITEAALNTDFTNLASGLVSVEESFRSMAQQLNMFTTTYQRASERLVGSMSASMSEI